MKPRELLGIFAAASLAVLLFIGLMWLLAPPQ